MVSVMNKAQKPNCYWVTCAPPNAIVQLIIHRNSSKRNIKSHLHVVTIYRLLIPLGIGYVNSNSLII